MTTTNIPIQLIIEAALLVAGRPLNFSQLQKLFAKHEKPEASEIHDTLKNITERFNDSGIELRKTASGWQLQSRPELGEYISRLNDERPPRYSRALLETLALIAWRQPITRAEIEEIRGVTVSSNIVKTLIEREWVRVIGHRDIPGKPAILGTTKIFLDYFNLNSLKELPKLSEITDPETQANKLQAQLDLSGTEQEEEAEEEEEEATEEETCLTTEIIEEIPQQT